MHNDLCCSIEKVQYCQVHTCKAAGDFIFRGLSKKHCIEDISDFKFKIANIC